MEGLAALAATIVFAIIIKNEFRRKEKIHELNKKIAASEKRFKASLKKIRDFEF